MKPTKIVPLGVSGAGKSAYLASLYDRLAMERVDTCFSLRTEAARAQELIKLYRDIENPERGWPPGTMGSQYRDFPFDCVIPNSKHEDTS